jgi:hypothetical protein
VEVAVVPSPNCPEVFCPQHLTPLAVVRAQVWNPPAETALDSLNIAVSDISELIITVQVPVPGHPLPDQPVKIEPKIGVAVKATDVLLVNIAEQATSVATQSIPIGLEVMVPDPNPSLVMSRLYILVNVAVTDVVAFIVTSHVPVPGQLTLDQPEKTDPTIGVAVNVTGVLLAYEAVQVAPQSIPLEVEVTVPKPDPALVTVRANLTAETGVAKT